jgi:hypothetical protein
MTTSSKTNMNITTTGEEMKLKRLKNPRTGKLIGSYFIFKGDVIYGIASLKWWEKLIFWKKGIKWVKRRTYNRWKYFNSLPKAWF